jgi:hypothetical protein
MVNDVASLKRAMEVKMNTTHGCAGASTRIDTGAYCMKDLERAKMEDSMPFSAALVQAMRANASEKECEETGKRKSVFKVDSGNGRASVVKKQSSISKQASIGKSHSENGAKPIGKEKSETVENVLATKKQSSIINDDEDEEEEDTQFKIKYESYLPSIYEKRIPGWLMTSAGVPVGSEELLLLEGVVETVQSYMFMRFQARIAVKLWMAVAFVLFPIATGMSTARWNIGTVDIFKADLSSLMANNADLTVQVAAANTRVLAGIVFLVADIFEVYVINMGIMLYESRNPVKKMTLFNMLIDIEHVRVGLLLWFQWLTLYLAVETTNPYRGMIVRDHMTSAVVQPHHIASDPWSPQYENSRLVPANVFTMERLIGRSYEICDRDGRHGYEDYPVTHINGKLLAYEQSVNTVPVY